MPFTAALIAAGRLAGVAVAGGFNLYATVALLGLASRNGWSVLPAGLRGLEHPIVIGSALALYLAEFVFDKFPYVEAVWEGIHTLIRPLAVGLLALLVLLDGRGVPEAVAFAMILALITLLAHGAKAGLRMAVRTPQRPWVRVGVSLLEDLAALGIAAAALFHPVAAALVALLIGALLIAAGPGLWRAGLLGLRALVARLRGFFGGAGWQGVDALPAVLRSLIRPDPEGVHPPRAARAAVYGIRAAGAYRTGWLVMEHGAPVFIFRALFASRRLDLPRASSGRIRPGLMLDVLELNTSAQPYSVFLLKDGPAPQAALAELTTG